MDGVNGGSWNPIFSRPFNDWEVEEAKRLLSELGRYVLTYEAEYEVRWMLTKNRIFFFYQ